MGVLEAAQSVGRLGLIEKVTFVQRLEDGERVRCASV